MLSPTKTPQLLSGRPSLPYVNFDDSVTVLFEPGWSGVVGLKEGFDSGAGPSEFEGVAQHQIDKFWPPSALGVLLEVAFEALLHGAVVGALALA